MRPRSGDPCHKGQSGASTDRAARPREERFHRLAPALNLAAMDERPKSTEKASQQRRLGAALRANLKRRKAQAKGRATAPGAEPESADQPGDQPHDSAGIAGHKQRG
jgi:hypothetical protein